MNLKKNVMYRYPRAGGGVPSYNPALGKLRQEEA
jgi:hypothetical protein